jgi:hypothetical protein
MHTKAQKIRWIEHIVRMDEERTVKRRTEWRPTAVRRIRRLRLRLENDVRGDLGKMKIRVGVKWLWIEKHGRELLSTPKLTKGCSTRTRRLLTYIHTYIHTYLLTHSMEQSPS